ncbi:MAG: wax ester/triacylglycerol synthase family O-acyltransferase [Solirubrobacteraceae bacterium]
MAIDRLSALDTAFLDLETARAPLHVGWTLRFDAAPPSLAALRRHLDGRLDRVPRFRRRLADLPGGLAWVDDPSFDIAHHVHEVSLPKPGAPGDLRDTAGVLLSRPLDHARPLWRMYLVSGVAGGGFALVGQVHHALVDGIAAIEVATLLFDDGAEQLPSSWRAVAGPSASDALRASLTSRARGGLKMLGGLAAAASPAALRGAADALGDVVSPAPSTALDRSHSARRVVAFGSAPLADVKEAGRRRGATVNDVLLAATAIALGHALARRGEHPRALKAVVPVSVRDDEAAADVGNAISFAAIELPLGETDPTAVLRLVRDRTRTAKRDGAARPLALLAQAGDLLPAAGRRAIARTAARVASFNAVVSNVPGPPVELSLMDRPIKAIHPAVPLLDGHGLTVCGLSYAGRLQIGIYADAAVLPDAVDVARDLESAFDALRLAPARAASGPTPWRAKARARRQREAKR